MTGKYWVKVGYDNWLLVDGSCIQGDVHNAELPCSSKPPLGVMPKKLWEEKRAKDLCEAIQRYLDNGRVIPKEWVDELLLRTKREDWFK